MLLSPSSLAVLAGLALFLAAGYQVIQCALCCLTSPSRAALQPPHHTCVSPLTRGAAAQIGTVSSCHRKSMRACHWRCGWRSWRRPCCACGVRWPALAPGTQLHAPCVSLRARPARLPRAGTECCAAGSLAAQGGVAETGSAACRESAPGRGAAAHQCARQPGVRAPATYWAPMLCVANARSYLAQ